MFLLLLEISIMVSFTIYGLVKGGALGSGLTSSIALFIMMFVFNLPPSDPPVTAVLIIISIGIASGALQVSGGMDYMISVATKIIKKFPKAITIVAPLVCFMFVFGMGTAMISLSLEPIIAETAIKSKVNPKEALILSVLASNMALLCSPAASSTVFVVMLLLPLGISMGTYLSIVLPSTIISIFLLSLGLLIVNRKGSFNEDTLIAGEEMIEVTMHENTAKYSTYVFLTCVLGIVVFGLFPGLLPQYTVNGESVKIATADLVQMFMYASAALNLIFFKANSKKILNAPATMNALAASLVVLGGGWLGGTIFSSPGNQEILTNSLGAILGSYPWFIIILCSFVAMIIGAQTAVAAIVFPVALALGISPLLLVIIVQCLNVNFIIPAQPTMLLACELDRTGRTKTYNFIVPGFAITALSIVISYGVTLFI